MTAITSIFISHVETSFTPEYIIEAFYCQGIATVSRVTLLLANKKYNGVFYYNAYVEIAQWHETEAAYSLISRLKNPTVEARFAHADDNWWVCEINQDTQITHDVAYKAHTFVNYLVDEVGHFIDYEDIQLFDELSYLIEQERSMWNLETQPAYVF